MTASWFIYDVIYCHFGVKIILKWRHCDIKMTNSVSLLSGIGNITYTRKVLIPSNFFLRILQVLNFTRHFLFNNPLVFESRALFLRIILRSKLLWDMRSKYCEKCDLHSEWVSLAAIIWDKTKENNSYYYLYSVLSRMHFSLLYLRWEIKKCARQYQS